MPDRTIIGLGIGFVLLILAGLSIVTIDAGHVGVIKRFGAVEDRLFMPGLHFIMPLVESVDEIDTRLDGIDATAASASRDLQTVTTKVSIQYALLPILVPAMVNDLGSRQKLAETVIAKAIQESVKASTARYNAEELITKRVEVKAAIQQSVIGYINDTLKDKELTNLAEIANMSITDFQFSDDFNDAIEAKVKTEQDALRIEIEKRQRITRAEAAKREVELNADAAAYKTTAEAKARADAINQEGEALRANPSVIQLRIAEKWDGVLPRINGGVLPLLNLNSNDLSSAQEKAASTTTAK